MEELTEFEEQRIVARLAPLGLLSPATGTSERNRPRPLRALAVLLAVVGALSVGGIAVARVTFVDHASPARSPRSLGAGVACNDLIGMDARRAAELLAKRGVQPSWRLTRYVDPAQHGGVVGYASSVAAPPAGTVVEDVSRADGTTIVFLRGHNDSNAPPLAASRC
jgi:hypothetical protein